MIAFFFFGIQSHTHMLGRHISSLAKVQLPASSSLARQFNWLTARVRSGGEFPPPKICMFILLPCDLGGILPLPFVILLFFNSFLIERKWLPYHWGPPMINSSPTCLAGAIAPLSSARCSQSNTRSFMSPILFLLLCVREEIVMLWFSVLCLLNCTTYLFAKSSSNNSSNHTTQRTL